MIDNELPTNPIRELLELYSASTLTVEELKTFPPPTWLIKDYVMQSSQAVIWGAPAAGKSFVALDWALCVATGRRWFRKDVVEGNSLYILGEGALGAIAKRIEAWEMNKGQKIEDESFLVVRRPVKMLENYADLIVGQLTDEQQCATGKPTRLIVIDTLARAVVGHNENDSAEMGRLIEVADTIKDKTKATVLFVHHSSTSQRMRGSTALGGGLDTEIEMVYDENTKERKLRCRKQKDADYFADQEVHFKEMLLSSGYKSVVPSMVKETL